MIEPSSNPRKANRFDLEATGDNTSDMKHSLGARTHLLTSPSTENTSFSRCHWQEQPGSSLLPQDRRRSKASGRGTT